MLDLRGLSLSREGPDGPFPVIQDLDLHLSAGERLAVLGGNGSGKSSLLRHLAVPGVVPGVRVGLVCQDPDEQLVTATVADELTLGSAERDPGPLLAAVGLDGCEGDDPRLLSAGQKQRLQLAVVLANDPDLLLLDEPGSLQDPTQAAWLRDRLASWTGTLIWATQRRSEVRVCSRALVLDGGWVQIDGEVEEVLASDAARQLWPAPAPRSVVVPPADAAIVVRLTGVGFRFHRGGVADLNLELRAGERLGITGPNGCGKSTLLAAMAGLRRPDEGTIVLGDRALYRRGRHDLDHGLAALAPQFPEYQFATGSVTAESRLSGLDIAAVLTAVGLDRALAARHPHDLSGGQKRRLALALALLAGRPLVLIDEPTAALDAEGRARVVAQIDMLPTDAALVIASHDVSFLRACGCRVLAMGESGLREHGIQ